MADYYPLVAKAVAGLEKNTGEGRRALYERARIGFGRAVARDERPAADRGRDHPRAARARGSDPQGRGGSRAARARCRRGPNPPRAPEGARDLDAPPAPPPPRASTAARRRRSPPPTERPGTQPRNRTGGERRSVTDEGLKGFRDVIAEAEALGDATAQGAKTAREVFAATPPTTSQTSTGSNRASSRRDCARRCARRVRAGASRRGLRSRAPNPSRVRRRMAARAAVTPPHAGAPDRNASRPAAAGPDASAFGRRHRRAAEALARRAGGGDPHGADHSRPRRRRLLAARPHRRAGQRRARPRQAGAEGCAALAAENSRPGRPAGGPAGRGASRPAVRPRARSRRLRSASCSTRKTRPTRRASAMSARRSGAPRP